MAYLRVGVASARNGLLGRLKAVTVLFGRGAAELCAGEVPVLLGGADLFRGL